MNSIPSNPEGRRSHQAAAEIPPDFPLPPSITFGYTRQRAVVVVEGATVRPLSRRSSTMIVIGLVLGVVGIGFFCWLLFIARRLCAPVLRGGLRRLGGLSRRRRAGRRHLLSAFSPAASTLVARPERLRDSHDPLDPGCGRTVVRGAGGACRLPRHARPREADHAVRGLADRVLDRRRCCCRRHSLDAHGIAPGHPTQGIVRG